MIQHLPFIVSITIEGTMVKDTITVPELNQTLKEAVWLGTQTIMDNVYGSISDYKARVEVTEDWIDGRFRGSYRE